LTFYVAVLETFFTVHFFFVVEKFDWPVI